MGVPGKVVVHLEAESLKLLSFKQGVYNETITQQRKYGMDKTQEISI